ncbi:MAG: hypothetical protein PHF51_01040 [Candidatus ainarchaeum sp.]|nr:hypothetical protein [Candidatus ainarchaeum sp.]
MENPFAIALIGISVACSLLVFAGGYYFGPLAILLMLVSIIAAPVSFVLYKWGYWMIPYFTQRKRVIESKEADYEIPLTDDVVVKRVGDGYYATMFAAVRIFKSATTMSEKEKFSFMELWERAVSSLKTVTKYSVLVYIKDLSRYKDSIEERKARTQMEIAKENEKEKVDPARILTLEREISMWDNVISKVSSGDRPRAMLTYVQVSAKGATKDTAIAAVRQTVNEIRGTVGTTLNAEVAALTGDDLRRCVDWSYCVPASVKEL